jgi:hypothetical protein
VIPLVIVIVHPLPDPFGQLGGGIVIVQQDKVLQRPVVTFDLPLGHGVIDFGPNMTDLVGLEVLLQLMGDVTGPVGARAVELNITKALAGTRKSTKANLLDKGPHP